MKRKSNTGDALRKDFASSFICGVIYICCKKNKAKIQPAIPYATSSQFHFPLVHKSNASLMRVAINPDHIISGKNTAEVVKKNDHRKCNCRSILKYVRSALRSGLRGTSVHRPNIGQRILPKTKKRLLGQISAFLGMTVSSMGKESMNGGAESFVSYAKPDSESGGEMSAMDANLLQQPLERPTL